LLPLDVATKVFEKKQGQKFKSPVKTIVAKRKPSSPTPTKALPSSAKKSVVSVTSASEVMRWLFLPLVCSFGAELIL